MTEIRKVDRPALPQRDPNGHKGTFGRTLIIGGSVGFSGAVCLASTAALRSGSGLVTAAIPQSIQSAVAGYEPSFMTVGLPVNRRGLLQSSASAIVPSLIKGKDSVGIGPGLGTSPAAASVLRAVFESALCPVVVDADGLNLLARNRLLFMRQKSPVVLTPHPGEFARLTGHSIEQIQANREVLAARFANESGAVVVLKGPGTIVTDGRTLFRNTSGNSGMATGGSGDVLTGVIVSLLGQGLSPFNAAAVGVYAHGLAGDLAAAALGPQGMIASDLLRFLPPAWREIDGSQSSTCR
ncbi:MAG: NAD(P)H-hydrate dehydratase [Planctomycetaceae bacterium]|nr:NAD(P)H-hydrate dehydratase [Planctomycetaceae bacterium]